MSVRLPWALGGGGFGLLWGFSPPWCFPAAARARAFEPVGSLPFISMSV
eukprot:CAMPEP_0182569762 /NCGR_PEP_ID=MMETSP1324-20130603/10293_1 /TAXON_ID=236786 /ORGANISM="Florenciella sp., Strain RCC1587" /LENGTH=48 /DNA_ID= /DNA_START= /DNA_END= /DNA_ORIENTATION=